VSDENSNSTDANSPRKFDAAKLYRYRRAVLLLMGWHYDALSWTNPSIGINYHVSFNKAWEIHCQHQSDNRRNSGI
jgi:hypothetical protein